MSPFGDLAKLPMSAPNGGNAGTGGFTVAAKEMKTLIKRVLIYGFPFFLLFIETILREALAQKGGASVGPSLAAAGVGFLISLIIPKQRTLELSAATDKELKDKKMSVIPTAERKFIDVVWLLTFLLIASWTYDVYVSYKTPELLWWRFPALLVIGFANYFVGVICSEVREVI